jgi:hypothetical protein
VIGDGEDGAKERSPGVSQGAEFVDGPKKDLLIGHTPGRGEGRVLEMFLLNEPVVAVAHGERAHSIEKASSAVQKHGGIAIALQHASNGFNILRAIPFDDGVPGQRGERRKNTFEATHGTVAGGVKIGE